MDCGLSLLSGALHQLAEGLNGAAPVQRLPWLVVHQIGDGVQRLLVVDRQVGALGQHLAQQPVGVLAGPALPGAVRITEVHADVGIARQLSMPRHLAALVAGQRLAQ